MTTSRRTLTGVAAGALLLSAALATFAGERDHDDARGLREQGEIVPLEQILQAASAQRPGRVVEVDLERKDDTYVYEIEILDAGGEVWELKYDARKGTLLKEEAER